MSNRDKHQQEMLDDAIDRVYTRMSYLEVDSEEYATMMQRLDKLTNIKNSKTNKVSNEALLTIGANLLGIILILGYERAHIVTSKALGFVVKSKV